MNNDFMFGVLMGTILGGALVLLGFLLKDEFQKGESNEDG